MLKGKNSVQEISDWLAEFQQIVNKVAGNQNLQFTIEIWINDDNLPHSAKKDRVQIVENDEFPSLDMKMSWSPEGGIQFGIFRKNGHKLKYVSMGNTHTPGNIHIITSGVLNRLPKIISPKTYLNSKKVDNIYPDHANTLCKVGLATPIFPIIG